MASPAAVFLSLPEASLFAAPPSRDPLTIPAPPAGFSSISSPPFTIPQQLYTGALDVRIPITIASVYAASVLATNAYNKANGNKPWAISKTKSFFYFVVIHNIFLAAYSGWTFWGMLNALQRTVVSWRGPSGIAGTVDSLCKMHGRLGTGNSVSYSHRLSQWVDETSPKSLLNDLGAPLSTDFGRLWNEGLAFYGWFFYLSKFYEVLDTVIILAKGKKSSTLQTYHHAGAMMCMWAGIRYMSPPIWMFVLVNSGIHAMMYTYYTITAFSIRVPQAVKRSLTTMQILQFQVGVVYAAIHSFISYRLPVRVPIVVAAVKSVPSTIPNSIPFVASYMKKLLFRAAGEEGLAENVVQQSPEALSQAAQTVQEYTTEWKTVPCIDTSGQTFAIWLNVLYLVPLMALFVRFFVKSYLRRSGVVPGKGKMGSKHEAVEKAVRDAERGIERRLLVDENITVNCNGKAHGNGHVNGNGAVKLNGNGKANGNGHVKMNGKMNGMNGNGKLH